MNAADRFFDFTHWNTVFDEWGKFAYILLVLYLFVSEMGPPGTNSMPFYGFTRVCCSIRGHSVSLCQVMSAAHVRCVSKTLIV